MSLHYLIIQFLLNINTKTYAIDFEDWDRCRMKCPVEKPIPPTRPNAQLQGDESYGNWDKELWEGEIIRYKCENQTLVIDNTKGLLKKEYQCQLDGNYDTPDYTGHLWPECTEQPVDPSKLDNINWKDTT